MSKDQKKTNSLSVESVENLKFACKVINEILNGMRYWKYDQIWPINLYFKSLEKIIENLNYVIFECDIDNKIK